MSHRSLNIIIIVISGTVGIAILVTGFASAGSIVDKTILAIFAAGPLSTFIITLLFMSLPDRFAVKEVPVRPEDEKTSLQ